MLNILFIRRDNEHLLAPSRFFNGSRGRNDSLKKSVEGSLLRVEQIVRKIIEVVGIAAVVILMVMVMLTVADVALRFFFNKPISGSAEYTSYLMVGTGFLGLAWCALTDGHVGVDLIATKLSKRGLALTDTLNYILALAISLLIGIQTIAEADFVQKFNVRSTITGIPTYPFYLVVAFGYLMLFIAVAILLVHAVRRIKQ